jgi:EmrB/QacA subfamily drug resistance transporter
MQVVPDRNTVAGGDVTSPSARGALAGLALTMLLASLGTSIANVALPTFAQAFSASFQSVQWVVLAYLLAVTVLVVSAGRLGDMIGRRRLLLGGLVLFTAASVLCGVAPTLTLLIAARAVQGLGAAIMMALTMAMVGEAVSKEKTGSAMGLLGTMSAIGTALGPSLGGVLIAGFGWRAIFLVNVPLGLAAILLAARYLPAVAPAGTRSRFDRPGTLLLVLTLTAYALAMTLGRGSFGAFNIALLAAAVVGAVVFVAVEARVASPLIPPAMFSQGALSGGFAMSALVTTVMMTTLVVGPFYLARALDLDAARVGLVMSAGPAVAALAGVPSGRIVDKFGAARMTLAGLVMAAMGCGALATLPASSGIAGYIAPLVVLTAGYALFQAANNTAVMTATGAAQRGVTSGLLNLSRNLGLITGASAMGAVFAVASGSADVATAGAAAVAFGMRATFGVAAALIVMALAIGMAGGLAGASRRT